MTTRVRWALAGLLLATGCGGGGAAQGGEAARPASSATAAVPAGDGGKGPPTADEMKAIIREHSSDLKRCYERERTRGQAYKGVTKIRVKASPVGAVTEAEGVDIEPAGDFLATCAIESVKTWKFPASAGGASMLVPIPW